MKLDNDADEIKYTGKYNVSSRSLTKSYETLHVHPWLRFFARYIDLYLFAIVIQSSLLLIYPQLATEISNGLAFLILFLWIFIEPIFLSTWGTTPGKFILNIKLTDLNHNKLKFSKAFSRSFWVWLLGFSFGLPLISLITLYYSYTQLKYTGTTSWDRNNFIVTHGKVGLVRAVAAGVLIATSLLLTIFSIIQEYHLI